ncbi:protein of unknown function [Desulfuromusa kysingii]|uniref:Response regulatory domain-containing protein n=1 Tax=Desulfuromusa kysingii TaxID=37625 RepID=A0A1H4CAE5_9BACT|nr:response regulator [Desulfuromusa kysingii]SEA57072.1 protein of unknown function [Desulfuromusa kysingii]
MTGYRINIIDDDPTTYEILNIYLKSAGFRVQAAFDGRAGLDMMRNAPPDLALLDIQMPELNGFQLLETMRRDNSLRDIPVLFLTSLDRTNLKIKGLELGADDFIVKPFERAELFARIKAALRRSERYLQTENILKGNLADISLTELLQTLDIGKKIARIKLPEMHGEVVVDSGILVDARQGRFSGEAAMTRLLFLDRGSFIVDFSRVAEPDDDQAISIQHQVLNCLTQIDKAKNILAALPGENPMIDVFPPTLSDAGLTSLAELLPCALKDLLVMMPGDLVVNAEIFVKEFR